MIETTQIEKTSWGTNQGKEVFLYTLTNALGSQLQVATYGGILVSFKTADKAGNFGEVLLGKDNLEDYLDNTCYLGVIAGRFANRIAKGKVTIDGTDYTLATNNGENFLHGGAKGFDQKVWDVVEEKSENGTTSLVLSYVSADGEENLPGTMTTQVKYSLTDDNEIVLEYTATTDKKTVINLTSHPYFNLKGEGDIADVDLKLNCEFFTPIDETCIPTGEIISVKGTPFDFTETKKIGLEIDADYEQNRIGVGYDHNLVINKPYGEFGFVGEAYDATTGRAMSVYTTEPGIQFYTGNWLEGEKGRNQTALIKREGFCLEAQHYPDTPNQPHFPSAELNPGETYTQKTVYKFFVK
ncbi:galactose mutarotase [Flammeovirga pectinis]|uniref:Aldose 1-epimerase n=1 Tax=Flammeovirga pectinis TaxID=2494373 RepID=A0A3S9PBV6_9BACT|nr:aldose epimerase family protein [Flammeovirga pectinis]AZQ65542.1 galactose mutarotase [Flammeovirga pectinis]